jgi:hypothetical protein
MGFPMDELSPRFTKGYEAIKSLSEHPRYQAAFIFGSVAEGTSNSHSDLDVKVIVTEDNPCGNINHPTFDDYKLDITFRSFPQIQRFTEEEIRKGEREPNLVRGVIVFDKTGELTRLQEKVRNVRPQKYSPHDYQFIQFMLYHANNKVERFLEEDALASLYSMHANIGDVLKFHFKLNGRWWVSSKNVLNSLEDWDQELAQLVKHFVSTADVKEKYRCWAAIMDHVAATMGGRQPIAENNCDCEVCKTDMAVLVSFR